MAQWGVVIIEIITLINRVIADAIVTPCVLDNFGACTTRNP